jgi:PIN domain nuclease of toxin-antitoxin system
VLLLLDTHVWIWALDGDKRRIGPRTRRLLQHAVSRESIRVSAASVFEITALHASGRLRLTLPVDRWIDDALGALQGRLLDITLAVALDAGHIQRSALPDPIDRFIVATARDERATLLTCDRVILGHARSSRAVRAEDAGA